MTRARGSHRAEIRFIRSRRSLADLFDVATRRAVPRPEEHGR
ncbi:MAG TPA: hypothetical protein VMV92_05150 [Streptosporangiaceae bacterium]|nr:hypothetical protein [Streptosporangiaceae bacterium]